MKATRQGIALTQRIQVGEFGVQYAEALHLPPLRPGRQKRRRTREQIRADHHVSRAELSRARRSVTPDQGAAIIARWNADVAAFLGQAVPVTALALLVVALLSCAPAPAPLERGEPIAALLTPTIRTARHQACLNFAQPGETCRGVR